MDKVLASPGAWIDVLGGVAQMVLAFHLIRSRSRGAVFGLAAFFALNGLAFLLGNLVPRGHTLFPLLRLTAWGTLNWIAFVAILATAASLLTLVTRRYLALTVASVVAGSLVLLSWASAPQSMTAIAFGGSAVYGGVAALLVVCLFVAFGGGSRARDASVFVAMTAVNSGLHVGVTLLARANAYSIAHAAILLALAGLWLRSKGSLAARLAAAGSLLIPIGLGVAAISVLASQAAVQDSGLYGIGRTLSVVIGTLALRRGLLLEEPHSSKLAPAAA